MLKPVDILVLCGIAVQSETWTQTSIAEHLKLSQSSVHRALAQLERSSLWSPHMGVRWMAVRELFASGLRYVYPATLQAPSRGLPTAHSAPAFASEFRASETYVWPWEGGSDYGVSVSPIHPNVPAVAASDPAFHELMATVELLRVGRVRERTAALQRLAGYGSGDHD